MSELKNTQSSNTNPVEEKHTETTGFKRAVPIILFAAAAFTALCFLTQDTGILGNFIGSVFMGLFSYAAYSIPVLLVIHGIFYLRDIDNKCVLSRAIFSVITVLAFSALAYTIHTFGEATVFEPKQFYIDGTEGVGGGFIGSVLSFALMKIFGSVGMIVIAVAIFALYISFFFAKSKKVSGKFLYFLLSIIVGALALIEKGIKKLVSVYRNARQKKKDEIQRSKDEELFADSFFEVDNGMQELNIPKLGIKEIRSADALEANPTLHEKVHHKSEVEHSEPFAGDAFIDDEAPIKEDVGTQKKRVVDFSYGTPGVFLRDTTVNGKDGESKSDYIVIEATDEVKNEPVSRNKLYGLDENAEDVFTKDFDPFDFVANEQLAQKQSSKAATASAMNAGIGEIEEPLSERSINNITPEEVEKARKLYDIQMKQEALRAEFERKKKAALENMRHQATPVTSSAEQIGEVKSVEINVASPEVISDEADAHSYHATYEKSEPQPVYTAKQTVYAAPMQSEPASEVQPTAYSQPTVSEPISEPAYGNEAVASDDSEQNYTADLSNAEAVTDAHESLVSSEDNSAPVSVQLEEDEAVVELANPTTDTPTFNQNPFSPTLEDDEDDIPSSDMQNDFFAPVDIPEAEEEQAPIENSIFAPFETPASTIPAREASYSSATLHTERSMINPIITESFDDEDDELSEVITPGEEVADEPEIIPPEERNPEVAEMRKMFPFLDDVPKDELKAEIISTVDTPAEFVKDDQTPPFEIDEPFEEEEEEKPKKPDFSNYQSPPIDILTRGEALNESMEEEIQDNANRLIETLASFNVTVSIKGVDRGPRITRYEVVPGPGVKVTQVTNLENDIKLNLAAEGMRIKAPIPGKSAIGIEIPNKKSETVRLRDLIETEEYQTASSKTFFCVGKDVAGYPVFNDIEKMPHMLVAGATGMGKSVFINSLMISLLYKARPDEVRFIMIDPKKLEFNMYNGIPHLLVPVVTDPKQAAGALMWAVEQMEKRYDMIGALNVRNINAYNEKVKNKPELGEPMTRIIIVIDEFADLMLQVRNPVENLVMSIAQKARAAGIHLIIGTQRPSVNVLTGVIKANIPSRFTCKVVSNVDSRTIIEQAGAEKLLNRGDMLYMIPGMSEPERVQSAFVSDNEVEEIMDFLKSQSDGNTYDNNVLEEINRAAIRCSKDGDEDDRDDRDRSESGEGYLNDRQFLDAVEIAVNSRKISTSLLQRKISIGFGKAAKFIDIMEDMGIVSGPNGQKPRDVLISPDEWHEKLARTELD